jgi:hypothetical protein
MLDRLRSLICAKNVELRAVSALLLYFERPARLSLMGCLACELFRDSFWDDVRVNELSLNDYRKRAIIRMDRVSLLDLYTVHLEYWPETGAGLEVEVLISSIDAELAGVS